ncbi:hypothetical protein BDN70DRAFT_95210 [Pholiota conissans]|uniref:Uncharacterized protein n=1 Tax=Pholiota conissans TaxID=109636 RepID=A0A9P5YXR7_9AGAR|nr:hypothetical protein BDN70DRAFT_95210 [Pholiota conissans]
MTSMIHLLFFPTPRFRYFRSVFSFSPPTAICAALLSLLLLYKFDNCLLWPLFLGTLLLLIWVSMVSPSLVCLFVLCPRMYSTALLRPLPYRDHSHTLRLGVPEPKMCASPSSKILQWMCCWMLPGLWCGESTLHLRWMKVFVLSHWT